MTNEELRSRGLKAKEILEDEIVQEALTAIRNKYMEEWKKSPARDTEGRERIYVMMKIVDSFETHLNGYIAEGKLAEKILTDEKGKIRQMFGR